MVETKVVEGKVKQKSDSRRQPASVFTVKTELHQSEDQHDGPSEVCGHWWVLDETEVGKEQCHGVCRVCGCSALFGAYHPSPRQYICESARHLVDALVSIRVNGVWHHSCRECVERPGATGAGHKKARRTSRRAVPQKSEAP